MANVLSLVPYPFSPARTGGQKAIALFYKYFSREVHLTCAGVRKNDLSAVDGYTLVPLMADSSLRYLDPLLFFKIRRLIRKTNAGYFMIEHPYFGWLGWLVSITCPVKLVVRSHNIEGIRWKTLGKWWWPLLWEYEKFTHRRADYNIFIQEEERRYAIEHFGLDPDRCLTMTFGTERTSAPSAAEKLAARSELNARFTLDPDKPVMLINGAFQYGPNRQALSDLLYKINPLLVQQGFSYQLLVCGMDIPAEFLTAGFPQVKMLGFVEDLSLLLTGSDLMINPVSSGGGIKTKLVEAIAFGLNAVSSANGAIGVDPSECAGKLSVVPDEDWTAFAAAIKEMLNYRAATPALFYHRFSWPRLAAMASAFIKEN